MPRFLVILSLLGLALSGGSHPAAAQELADPEAVGRQYLAWFLAGEVDRLYEKFDEQMRNGMTAEGLAQFRAQVIERHGDEPELMEEMVTPYQGLQIYMHTGIWPKSGEVLRVQFALDPEGGVAGFFVVPAGEDVRRRATLRR